MLTLRDINETLQQQTEIANRTLMTARKTDVGVEDLNTEAKSIKSLIEDLVESRRQEALDAVEARREGTPGVVPSPGGTLPTLPPRPGSAPAELANPDATLSGWENLTNNIIGGMVGGGLAAKALPRMKGFLGSTLKLGAVALVADMLMNNLPETPDSEEIKGDVQRSIGGLALGSLVGKSMVGAVAGYIYDNVLSQVKGNDFAQQISGWIDQYSSKVGIEGDTVLSTAVAGTTALAAVEGTKFVAKKAVTTAAPVIAQGAKTAVTTGAPAAYAAAKTAVTKAIPKVTNAAKGGLSALFSTGGGPLAAFAATLGTLGWGSMTYRQMLEQYPELAPMNNGAGPGLQAGKYMIENNMIDEVIADQKARGLYKEKYKAPDMDKLKAPDLSSFLTTPPPPGTVGPKLSDAATAEINSYLGIPSGKAPTLVPPSVTSFNSDWIAGGKKEVKPTVIVVPASPAPAVSGGSSSRSSTAIFTQPVATTDRLDGMDRISRPQ